MSYLMSIADRVSVASTNNSPSGAPFKGAECRVYYRENPNSTAKMFGTESDKPRDNKASACYPESKITHKILLSVARLRRLRGGAALSEKPMARTVKLVVVGIDTAGKRVIWDIAEGVSADGG